MNITRRTLESWYDHLEKALNTDGDWMRIAETQEYAIEKVLGEICDLLNKEGK